VQAASDAGNASSSSAPPHPPEVTGKKGAGYEAGAGVESKSLEATPPAPGPPVQPPSKGRSLDVLEVARSVDQATSMKERLARDSIVKAREDVLAQRASLQAQWKAQELKSLEEEKRLIFLEEELKTGCNQADRKKVQDLRTSMESACRELRWIEKEVASKLEVMRKATDSYVEAQERLAVKQESRKKLEEEMLDVILSTGRAKDVHLTNLLMKVPEFERKVDSSPAASQPAKAEQSEKEDEENY